MYRAATSGGAFSAAERDIVWLRRMITGYRNLADPDAEMESDFFQSDFADVIIKFDETTMRWNADVDAVFDRMRTAVLGDPYQPHGLEWLRHSAAEAAGMLQAHRWILDASPCASLLRIRHDAGRRVDHLPVARDRYLGAWLERARRFHDIPPEPSVEPSVGPSAEPSVGPSVRPTIELLPASVQGVGRNARRNARRARQRAARRAERRAAWTATQAVQTPKARRPPGAR
jgi:hypothetical protein